MDSHIDKLVNDSENLSTALKENLNLADNTVKGGDSCVGSEKNAVRSEIMETDEVNVNSQNKNIDKLLKKSCFFKPKSTIEETLPVRAPRPLFMGPPAKYRRARGSRKNAKKNETVNERSNSNVDVNKQTASVTTVGTSAVSGMKTSNGDRQLNANEIGGPQTTTSTESVAVARNADSNDSKHIFGNRKSIDNNKSDNTNVVTNSKRQRSAQSTPENKPKRQRTFADVVSFDLKFFIMDKEKGISDVQAGLLEISLMDELDKFLATKPETAPKFHTGASRNGLIKIICVDSFSALWLKEAVLMMTPPWEGASLSIEEIGSLNADANNQGAHRALRQPRQPRRPTIRFFIPYGMSKPTFEKVIYRIQEMNKPLSTENWIAWKSDEKEDGTFYHVSVDVQHIDYIEAKQGRLHYGFGTIKMNLPKN